ncbi:hypothetical protein DITRI_Ditri10aG0005200 [Diplodiscus trichospermus]
MNSLAVKPSSFVLQSSSTVLSSCKPKQCTFPSVCFTRKIKSKRRLGLIIEAYDSSKSDDSSKPNGDSNPTNGSLNNQQPKTRRDILLEYVKNVQPEFMELFVKRAPQQVVEAMRQTVTNMMGTLPPQFFAVTVSTVAENLAQLMYSVMMTGYMFRNAQYRLELQQSLEQAALPEVQEKKVSLLPTFPFCLLKETKMVVVICRACCYCFSTHTFPISYDSHSETCIMVPVLLGRISHS